MLTHPKRAAALEILGKSGISRSFYEPPLTRLLWRLEFDVPPPHFVSFLGIAVSVGALFTISWGAIMWLFVWSLGAKSTGVIAMPSIVAGILAGLWAAGRYAYDRRKHKLPSWEDLESLS